MKNKIYYEWAVEEVEDGEIVECDFYDTLAEIDGDKFSSCGIGLVYNEGNEANGCECRLWAYLDGVRLPEYFSDASGCETSVKVPKRYHDELRKYLTK
jgi:hypothetical protein